MKKVILTILFLSLISGIAFSEVTRKITQKGYTKEAIYYSGNKEIAKEIFDEKGNIKRVGKIPNGIVKQYYESGKLEAEVNFKNGKKEGITKQYYENGKIWAEWNYKDDKLEGILKGYDDESGELRSEINLKDGKREGIIKTYYENGKLEAEGNYRDDKLEGIERRYNKNGEILAIDTYKKGIKINSKKYDTLGREIMNQDYPYEPVFTVENMEQG
ncbi:MAG: toxin-antitoxin system YwqK family antitoxin, partial [Candidatus Firestonebacteria bacterium]